eukprot:gene18554-18838_t
MFRPVYIASLGILLAVSNAHADGAWDKTLAAAKGQTVYWNAWGGDERTNAFIGWVDGKVSQRYGVHVQQVKLSDTAEAVNRVIAEKAAGKMAGGSVDMIWINGPNFLSMKMKGLLAGPFVSNLPNARFVDLSPLSAASVDFTVPVEGYESPWRLAKFVFNYNSKLESAPPKSMSALLDWSKNHRGRFTHPVVSNFMGATFLKQALIELTPDPAVLQASATDANFEAATKPLWAWYDLLRPNLWHKGMDFPASEVAQQQLLADGEVDMSMSFDPASAAAAIADGKLPDTIRTYALDHGTIGNVSFVAIPFNAAHKEAAMVVANFLLEPETQAQAQNINVLGSFSVLDQTKLNADQQAQFTALPTSPALPKNAELGKTLLEPDASWMTRLRLIVLAIVLGGFVLPVALGLWQTVLPAFGLLPAIGAGQFGLEPWQHLAAMPGFATSVKLTLTSGIISTILALMISAAICAQVYGRSGIRFIERAMTPLLATPHAAMAIGLVFVLSPSGWLARLLSPWATGWQVPPDIMIVHDANGMMLILGLLVKEVPFLLLVLFAALNQIPVHGHLAAGRALGYSRVLVWAKIILPQAYPQIRLSVYLVLAFALSVVDVALILGPSNPPTLGVMAMRLFMAPDATLLLPASAAAMLQAILVGAAIAGWWLSERVFISLGRRWIGRGGRGQSFERAFQLGSWIAIALIGLGILALVSLIVWSLAWRWSFPDFVPVSWSVQAWVRSASGWQAAFTNSVLLGLASTVLALLVAFLWLETEDRLGRKLSKYLTGAIFLPLILPQIAFLFGLNIVFLRAGTSGTFAAVIWVHSLFVFPYVMMALTEPWRALDQRYLRTAASLGVSQFSRLFRVKIPLLLRPLLASASIGFAVSVGQYVPTLVIGEGRIASLTTEAVTLSSGADHRIVGVYAVLQALLPLIIYAGAFFVPRIAFAGRTGFLRNSGQILVENFNLSVDPGEVVVVMGPSGTGKSTLLSFIGGHLGASFKANGRVKIGDRDVTALLPEQRRVGILFQDDLLFPHLSVGDNLAFGLVQSVRHKAERVRLIEVALETAGLAGFAKRDPATLSGGQRARIALFRTLLSEPCVLLLDEPFSKLDTELRVELRSFVLNHALSMKLPVLLVTHDPADAQAANGKIIRFKNGLCFATNKANINNMDEQMIAGIEVLLQNERPLRLAVFIGVFCLMALWELLAPRRKPILPRARRWPGNLGIVVLDTLLVRLIFPVTAVGAALYAETAGYGLFHLVRLPFPYAVIAGVILLDLAIYVQHVVFHHVPWLWRFHRMHHADTEFDVTTGLRFHPVEIALSMVFKLIVVLGLGAPVVAVVLFEILLNATAMFNHSNIRLSPRLDKIARLFLVTPDMHRVHHSVERLETDSNFGFNLPWWD